MVEEVVLDNGLVVVWERWGASVSGLALAFEAGSYADPPGLWGLAHLAEHMFFRSNEVFTAEELERRIELSGGAANAYTARDHMVVYMEATAGNLPRMAEILVSMASARRVPVDEFEQEKAVVLREVEGYRDDDRSWIVRLAIMAAYGEEAGRPIEGTPDSVSRIAPDDLEEFRERHFTAQNAVAAVAGNFSREELEAALRLLSQLPEGKRAGVEPPEPRPGDRVEERGRGVAQAAVAYLLPGIRALGDRYWDVVVSVFNLGVGATSALYTVLRREKGLVYSYNVVDEYEAGKAVVSIIAEDISKESIDDVLHAIEEEAWARLSSMVGDQGYVEGRKKLLRYMFRREALSASGEATALAVRRLTLGEALDYEERVKRMLRADWGLGRLDRLALARARALIT